MYFKQLYTWRRLLAYLSLVFIVVSPSLYASQASNTHKPANWHHAEQAIMGTLVSIDIEHDNPFVANQVISDVFGLMWDINNEMSRFKPDSLLSKINQEAASRPVKISDRLVHIIDKSLYYSRISNGAFDITVGTIGRHYDYRKRNKPTETLINKKLKHIDYKYIKLDKNNKTIKFSSQQTKIDLGGIAKGYAITEGIRLIKKFGIKNAYLSAGGDSYAIGTKNAQPWLIAIQDPRKKENKIAIPVSNIALSTSGDYERYFMENEQRYHHILNPKTGKSATNSVSVTVLGDSAMDTDALSTTLFVLGEKEGLKLINKIDGYDAIYVYPDGRAVFSDGIKKRTN